MRKVTLFIICCRVYAPVAFSQTTVLPVSYQVQGQVYAQSFDGLPATGIFTLTGKGPFNLENVPFSNPGLRGWQFLMAGGTGTNAGFLVSTGSSTGNGVQSFGAAGNTDRALGSLSTGSGVYAIGLLLTNNTGITLNSLTLSFTAEQWRKGGSGNKNTWTFHYKTGTLTGIDAVDMIDESHLNFSSAITTTGAGSLNGNLPENRQGIAYTLIGITWKPGEQLLLRWDDADETGNDDACAIDDLYFSAVQVEDIPSVINRPAATTAIHVVQLNALINDNNAPTDVTVEYDIVNTFLTARTLGCQPDHIDPGTGTTTVTAYGTSLSPGTTYYYRFKATNRNGTATGATADVTTPNQTDISSLSPVTIVPTNAQTVGFILRSGQALTGLTPSNFSLVTDGIDSAAILSVSGTGTVFTITVNTGKNSGTIKMVMVNDDHVQPFISNKPFSSASGYTIDKSPPYVTRLQAQANGIYKAGDTLSIIARFSEKIFVTQSGGSPAIKLTIGNNARQAVYMTGSGTDSILFAYVIQSTDEDSNGLKPATTITITNSAIKDTAGNNSSLTLPAFQNKNVRIDGVAPKMINLIVPPAKYYNEGDSLRFLVNFTENIRVNSVVDTPILKITIGSSVKSMHLSGVDTQQLRFTYAVQKNDLDKTGISLGVLATSFSNTITDIAGNPCSLTTRNAASTAGVKIDAIAPAFVVLGNAGLFACSSDSAILLTDALFITDEEKGDSITWTIQSLSPALVVTQIVMTAISTGSKISPAKLYYKTANLKNRVDTLLATVSDGINKTKKIVTVSVQPGIESNRVLSTPYVCSGTTANITGAQPVGGNGQYEYLWEYSIDSLSFSKVSAVSTQKDLGNSQKLSVVSWFRRKIVSGNCIDTSSPVKIIPLKTGLWLGTFTDEWQNTNNWCSAIVPGPATDVFILTGTANNPVITDTGSAHDLMIAGTGSLRVKGSLQVTGNISATVSSLDITKGSLTAAGMIPQNIGAGVLKDHLLRNLFVNNATGLFLSDTLYLEGSLRLISGYLQTNNKLLIRQTGSIGASADGTFISGNVSIEHLVAGGKRGFRLMGHPLSTDIGLQMIKDSIDITGSRGAEHGFINSATNNPSAFWYNTLSTKDTFSIDDNWTAFSRTNGEAENAWKKYQGIRLMARGRPGEGMDGRPAGDGNNNTYLPGAVTLKFTGPVNTGDQEITLMRSDSSGYNLVANPYASPVDLSMLSYGSGVSDHYWIWDPYQGDAGGYSAIPFQSSFILPAFSAFFVKSTALLNNTIVFTEHCKVSETPATILPVISNFPDHHLELRLFRDNIFMDRLFIYHSDSARIGIDKFDAEKFMNSGTNFYSLSREKKMLSIDARPITNASFISLGLQTENPGTFSIVVADSKLSTESTLLLHDKYLQTWMALEKDSAYFFSVSTDTSSSGNNRFEIISRPEPVDTFISSRKIISIVGPVPSISEIVIRYAVTEKELATMCIRDQYGNMLRSIPIDAKPNGRLTISIADLLPGTYFVEIRVGKYVDTKKIIKL